jgi:hypothetical protein
MANTGAKGDSASMGAGSEVPEAIRGLQQNLHRSDARLLQVEEASKVFAEMHQKINDKVDGI